MRNLLVFSLFTTLMLPSLSLANLPIFDATPEIEHCVKHTNSWDDCVKEAGNRQLNDIKLQYRRLLADKTLMEWNNNLTENKQFLHDTYESWTAYRNRVCALYTLSAQYSGSLINDNYSCNLGLMQQHYYYLENIANLLNKKVPEKQANYKFLRFEHDEQYKDCIKSRKTQKDRNCIKEENERSAEKIKQYYKEVYESERIGAWNNGPNLQNGNLRDMYDSWIAYRNHVCSLAVWAYKRAYGKKSASVDYCIESFNKNKLVIMDDIMVSSVSFLDIDIPEEDLQYYEKPDDAGKRIIPLERRFDNLEGFTNDTLEDEDNSESEPSVADEDAVSENNRPAWANPYN